MYDKTLPLEKVLQGLVEAEEKVMAMLTWYQFSDTKRR
jgi:hypothetical protein